MCCVWVLAMDLGKWTKTRQIIHHEHFHVHAHISVGLLFTCCTVCSTFGLVTKHCVRAGMAVMHNVLAGLNKSGTRNYDHMCQSQYLWKPKTLEPVHPSPPPSHLPFFFSLLFFPLVGVLAKSLYPNLQEWLVLSVLTPDELKSGLSSLCAL